MANIVKQRFNSLKITNIFLKSVNFENKCEPVQELKVDRKVNIENRDSNNVDFSIVQKVLMNGGQGGTIEICIGVQINVDIKEGFSDDEIEEGLMEIIQKIIEVNAIDGKVSLIIANLTNSFGDRPIIIPDNSFEVKNN